MQIVDTDTGALLGVNQAGELCIKTIGAFSGYYKRDSLEAFDSDGFVKTGDIVRFDEQMRFYVLDRIKEMFKCRAFPIVPAMIESVLTQHSSVEIGIIIGVPHPTDDNHIIGVVKPKPNHNVSEDDIRKFVNERMGIHNQLHGVIFVNHVVQTPTGKIKRRELRDQIYEMLKIRINNNKTIDNGF